MNWLLRALQRRKGEWVKTGQLRWRVAYESDAGLMEVIELEKLHTVTTERRWVKAVTGRPACDRRWTGVDGVTRYLYARGYPPPLRHSPPWKGPER